MSKRKRMFFRAAHRDAAEKAIITALRSVGASVYQVSGKDLPDLLVGFRGVTTLLEVKSRILTEDKGRKPRVRETRVSEGQKDFMAAWQGGPALVVFTPEAALIAIGAPFEGPAASATESPRFLAVNGAFLCPSCWLPENGLHAKDCPTRQALKRPAKVKSAYRAAKEAQEVLPKKTHQDRLNEAGAVDLRDNMRLEHLPGGYVRAEPIDPTKRHGAAGVLPKKVETWSWCTLVGCGKRALPDRFTCGEHPPISDEDARMAVAPESRGVEGELQPIKVKDTPHHWWENTDTTGIRECIHCHIRATLTYGAWQRKKGGHWRGSAHDLIPDCTGPIQNLPHAQNGA